MPKDPWEAAAQQYRAQVQTGAVAGGNAPVEYAQGVSNPPNGGQVTNIDNPEPNDAGWRVWEEQDQTPQENRAQRAFDNLTTVTPEQEKGHSWLTNKAQEFGAGVIQGVGQPFVHPIQTAEGFGNAARHPINTAASMAKSALENPAQALGNIVGGALVGEGAKMVAEPIMPRVAEGMKRTGGRMIDRAGGSTQADFRHGAMPGRAYLEGGGKPAFTMGSLSDKAERVSENAGKQLRKVYADSPSIIPADDVWETVQEPIAELKKLQSGPGGTGVNPTVQAYEDNMIPTIAAARARGGFAPVELFDEMKRPIARSTNWRDPSIFDLNQVRQENVGGVGGLLTDAVPEAKPLNRVFQGANNLANRTALRASTGSTPLATIGRRAMEAGLGAAAGSAFGHPGVGLLAAGADSVPGLTSGGYGLFQLGRVAPLIPRAFPVLGAGTAAVRIKPKADKN